MSVIVIFFVTCIVFANNFVIHVNSHKSRKTCPKINYDLILELKDVNAGYFDDSMLTTGLQNEDTPTANAYSIIGKLFRQKYHIKNKYQFMLDYRYSGETGDNLIWTQTSWLTHATITGYAAIQVSPDITGDTTAIFKGLALSDNNTVMYLDGNGNEEGNWHSVGSAIAINSGIPAHNKQTAIYVALYVLRKGNYCGNTVSYVCILELKDVELGYFNKSKLGENGLENEGNPCANTYSIIGSVNTSLYDNGTGYYQFMLHYRYPNNSEHTLVWKQSSWIIERFINGYEKISVAPIDISDAEQFFLGLGLSLTSNTYLDGNGDVTGTQHEVGPFFAPLGTIFTRLGGIVGILGHSVMENAIYQSLYILRKPEIIEPPTRSSSSSLKSSSEIRGVNKWKTHHKRHRSSSLSDNHNKKRNINEHKNKKRKSKKPKNKNKKHKNKKHSKKRKNKKHHKYNKRSKSSEYMP